MISASRSRLGPHSSFPCGNTAYRPMMDAFDLMRSYVALVADEIGVVQADATAGLDDALTSPQSAIVIRWFDRLGVPFRALRLAPADSISRTHRNLSTFSPAASSHTVLTRDRGLTYHPDEWC